MREKELSFSIFMIYSLADKWKMSPAKVYIILNSTGILDDYIIKCYDVLHTQKIWLRMNQSFLNEDHWGRGLVAFFVSRVVFMHMNIITIQKKGILSLSVRGIPLCRWSCHLRRCRGAATPLHCRVFYFLRAV